MTTPRTDAVLAGAKKGATDNWDPWELARTLETELAASEERIKTLRDEVLEECAKKCEQQMLTGWANEKGDCDEHNEGCRFSAEAIRALKAAK